MQIELYVHIHESTGQKKARKTDNQLKNHYLVQIQQYRLYEINAIKSLNMQVMNRLNEKSILYYSAMDSFRFPLSVKMRVVMLN